LTSLAAPEIVDAIWQRRAQESLTIVDAHAHSGPYSLFFIPENTPADMVRVMKRCGVSRAVLSSLLGIQLDARLGNEATARAVSRYPNYISGYLTVNPWQDPVAELEHWQGDSRFVGIKVHPDQHAYPLTGPRYRAVWEYAQSHRMPVLTHTWLDSIYDDVALVGAVSEQFPEIDLIAGHAGVLQKGFQRSIDFARRYPRLHLEVCGSHNHGRVIERMVDQVGSKQVLYGSDFPFIDMRTSLGRVMFATMEPADRSAVLGATMAALLDQRQG
jgi:predicted TIM-barrel fold metal-dependent hydrolase